MGKPWARYEQNYINHPKFLALTANAICLWLEGKNYCDMHQTDGLIPKEALKTFRFNGDKSVALLLRSCGQKPNLEPYAALWGPHLVGFKMHDYLDHNDCRDKVLARMEKAEDERARGREKQQAYRDRMREERNQLRMTNESVTVTGSLPDKQKQQQKQQQQQKQDLTAVSAAPAVNGRSKRPIYQSDRFVVFDWQLEDLGRMLGPHLDAFDLHGFFDDLTQRSRTQQQVIPRADVWTWLQQQVLGEAKRRKLPMVQVEAVGAGEVDWDAIGRKGPSVRG